MKAAMAINQVRFLLDTMTDEERLEAWAYIMEGYCSECGRWLDGKSCNCENGE